MNVVKRWYAQDGVETTKKRAKENGEVFTPEAVGRDMVDLVLARDPELINGVYLDPSCGSGNLLLCVLKKKVEAGIHPYRALEALYGIEIEPDNIDRCRERLADYAAAELGTSTREKCLYILNSSPDSYFPRVVCHDTLTWDVKNWQPINFPTVLNAHDVGTKPHPDRVYVGRPSKWGNPFVVGRDGSREEVIALYGDWLIERQDLLDCIPELRGKDLVCWCAPDSCHGDVLIQLANNPDYATY